MDATEILEELRSLADSTYKDFNMKIIPTQQEMLGVRIPALRKIAKRIAKDSPETFIACDKQNIYEMVMLEGMVLSYINKPFTELLPETENFLKKVDNWAQIDSTVGDYRQIKKQREEVLHIVNRWLHEEEEFVVRAGILVLLSQYVTEEYLPTIFELSQQITHKGYYVHMGNAWLISACMAKFPEETKRFFLTNTLDDITHNKAIQKSIESFRVSKEDKALLRTLKRITV